jgi:leucyl-tRNA synthetase
MAKKFGALKTTYRLRDWIFSRQRYWGEPIPMIWCEACGWQPVPDDQLPVKLPEVKNYQPRDDGESPLASLGEWVNTTCPKCGGAARRETDVMPNWAGSSWYYIRYTDPKNDQQLASPESLKYWTPVDWYNGGMEHTTLHLLYSRFWHKFLFDLGVVPTSEPYAKRTSHGLILAEDGEKMSKSRGNVVNPDKIVELYGADTLRLYEMFMGPFEQAVAWSTESIIGPRRFIEKVWRLSEKVSKEGEKVNIDGHLKKISDDIERISFNTAVSELMIVGNKLSVAEAINTETWKKFLKVLYPFTPHIAAELWEKAGERGSLQAAPWPEFDLSQTASSTFVMILQVNGVVRDRLQVSATATEEEVKNMALQQAKIAALVGNKEIKKVIYVPQKLLNFVV